MEWLKILLLSLNVVAAVVLIVLVLLQHGKGAEMGATFGAGSSASLFGATGSANFLSRSTAVAAFVFFTTSLGLSMLATYRQSSSVMSRMPPASRPAESSGATQKTPN